MKISQHFSLWESRYGYKDCTEKDFLSRLQLTITVIVPSILLWYIYQLDKKEILK